ncbi:RNA-directed DNA polymerase, eukaryota, reverse transcriptase zinc-binding domain protein, partial [Tanacetum coccineum]
MVGYDLPSQPPPVVNPPMMKSMKSLKPMKTTRTMNPDSKNTMRHEELLGNSSDVIFKEINTRSRSKRGDSVMVSQEMESSNGSNVAVKVKMVSNPSFESHVTNSEPVSDCLGGNSSIKSNGIGIMPEIHVPIAENHILIPNFSGNTKPRSPTKVSFGEVKRPCIFKVSGVNLFKGVESVSNVEAEEESRVNDTNVGDKCSVKKPFSFKNALSGDKMSGNNKLKYVVGSVNNFRREVAKMTWASFARVLVEVDSTKGLVDTVEVWYRSLGKSMMLDVEYVWRPPICEHCKIFRHTLKSCGAKDLIEEEKTLKESMKPVKADEVRVDSNNVGWQSARYRRNVYGKDGFSNNGRGSFGGGRGGYMNNGGRDNNDSTNKVSDATVIRSGSASGSNSKETKIVDVLPSKNRFTNEEEKGSWSDQMLDYYLKRLLETATKFANKRIVDKCNEEMIEYYEGACEDMRSEKINGYLDDVVDGSNATANFMANDEVSKLHDESMAEVQGVIRTQLRKEFVYPIRNGCLEAGLGVLNTVTLFVFFVYAGNTKKGRKRLWKNLVDHKSLAGDSPWVLLGDFNVLLAFDESSNYFSTRNKGIYHFKNYLLNLEIEDLNSYRMFYTWIEKRKDPNLGILKKLDRVMGNGDFMSVFDRSYANFLPYMTSDHCPVILVFPKVHCSKPKSFRFLNFLANKDNFLPTIRDNWNVDIKGFYMFVLAKILKNMKKHMRRLNKCNGNVFVKSKFLNTKLERFQRSLDKDPLNVLLREEEMIYLKAYSDAVPDEERLMKVSNSRIEVLSDDAGNTFYGDEISTKFVEHFENFFCDLSCPGRRNQS